MKKYISAYIVIQLTFAGLVIPVSAQQQQPFSKLKTGTVSVGTAAWTTVSLDHAYESMVVVTTPQYAPSDVPVVTRVRNANGNSFQVKVQRIDSSFANLTDINVHYVVMEEGVYDSMEAVKFTSTKTDHAQNVWAGELRSYSNTYTSPVVIGQVMTANDSSHSVFWARGLGPSVLPSASVLRVGKHVGEDPNFIRTNETIGYIVMEAGEGTIGEFNYVAGVTPNNVVGVIPVSHSFGSLIPSTVVLSSAGMGGANGGHPVLVDLTANGMQLFIDEDQLADAERRHIKEEVAYVALKENSQSLGDILNLGDPVLISGGEGESNIETVIDIAFLYDQTAIELVERNSTEENPLEIESFLYDQLDILNDTYSTSRTNVRFRMSHIGGFTISNLLEAPSTLSLVTTIIDIEEIKDIRDQSGSDYVFFLYGDVLTSDGVCGVGYPPLKDNEPHEDEAYVAAISLECVIEDGKRSVFSHEIGHSFGANHEDESLSDLTKQNALYDYARTYIGSSPLYGLDQYSTIMNSNYYGNTFIADYFSSPDLQLPILNQEEEVIDYLPLGDENTDNRRAILTHAPLVSRYRSLLRDVDLTDIYPGDFSVTIGKIRPMRNGTWRVAEGKLPNGLNLTYDGKIEGVFHGNDVQIRVSAKDTENAVHEAGISIIATNAPSPLQNPDNRLDVNNDGYVSALDVLLIINYIDSLKEVNIGNMSQSQIDILLEKPEYLDVNGDWTITAEDLIIIISYINSGGS